MSNQKKCHSPEQIDRKLGQADRLLGEGRTVADVCRQLEVAEQRIIGGATNMVA